MTTGNEKQQSFKPKRPNWGQIVDKADHGRNLRRTSPDSYREWLNAIKRMHGGDDLGQVEPWSPFTLRDTYYAGWANGDFGTLLSQLGEAEPVRPPTQEETEEV